MSSSNTSQKFIDTIKFCGQVIYSKKHKLTPKHNLLCGGKYRHISLLPLLQHKLYLWIRAQSLSDAPYTSADNLQL